MSSIYKVDKILNCLLTNSALLAVTATFEGADLIRSPNSSIIVSFLSR